MGQAPSALNVKVYCDQLETWVKAKNLSKLKPAVAGMGKVRDTISSYILYAPTLSDKGEEVDDEFVDRYIRENVVCINSTLDSCCTMASNGDECMELVHSILAWVDGASVSVPPHYGLVPFPSSAQNVVVKLFTRHSDDSTTSTAFADAFALYSSSKVSYRFLKFVLRNALPLVPVVKCVKDPVLLEAVMSLLVHPVPREPGSESYAELFCLSSPLCSVLPEIASDCKEPVMANKFLATVIVLARDGSVQCNIKELVDSVMNNPVFESSVSRHVMIEFLLAVYSQDEATHIRSKIAAWTIGEEKDVTAIANWKSLNFLVDAREGSPSSIYLQSQFAWLDEPPMIIDKTVLRIVVSPLEAVCKSGAIRSFRDTLDFLETRVVALFDKFYAQETDLTVRLVSCIVTAFVDVADSTPSTAASLERLATVLAKLRGKCTAVKELAATVSSCLCGCLLATGLDMDLTIRVLSHIPHHLRTSHDKLFPLLYSLYDCFREKRASKADTQGSSFWFSSRATTTQGDVEDDSDDFYFHPAARSLLQSAQATSSVALEAFQSSMNARTTRIAVPSVHSLELLMLALNALLTRKPQFPMSVVEYSAALNLVKLSRQVIARVANAQWKPRLTKAAVGLIRSLVESLNRSSSEIVRLHLPASVSEMTRSCDPTLLISDPAEIMWQVSTCIESGVQDLAKVNSGQQTVCLELGLARKDLVVECSLNSGQIRVMYGGAETLSTNWTSPQPNQSVDIVVSNLGLTLNGKSYPIYGEAAPSTGPWQVKVKNASSTTYSVKQKTVCPDPEGASTLVFQPLFNHLLADWLPYFLELANKEATGTIVRLTANAVYREWISRESAWAQLNPYFYSINPTKAIDRPDLLVCLQALA